jgi:PHD and RING finger domain-containing protein 1
LDTFSVQEIGTPDACDHIFCAKCIEEWSNNNNTCPLDRLVFTFILVRHSAEGEIIRIISVGPPRRQYLLDGYIFRPVEFCAECCEIGWEDRMITCPGCDLTYHLKCMNLNTKPLGEWICPMCIWTNTIYNAG